MRTVLKSDERVISCPSIAAFLERFKSLLVKGAQMEL